MAVIAFSLIAVFVDGGDGFHLLLLDEVDVNVLGDLGVGMAEELGNHLHLASVVEKHSGKGVAQGVNSNLLQADRRKNLVKGSVKARGAYSYAF